MHSSDVRNVSSSQIMKFMAHGLGLDFREGVSK